MKVELKVQDFCPNGLANSGSYLILMINGLVVYDTCNGPWFQEEKLKRDFPQEQDRFEQLLWDWLSIERNEESPFYKILDKTPRTIFDDVLETLSVEMPDDDAAFIKKFVAKHHPHKGNIDAVKKSCRNGRIPAWSAFAMF